MMLGSILLSFLQVAWSLQAMHTQRRGHQPKHTIVMMMSRGCSGSSFVYKQFFDLMEKHGYQVWSPEKEFITWKSEPNISTWSYCTEPNGVVHYWPAGSVARLQAARDVMDHKLICKEYQNNASAPTIFFFDGHNSDDMTRVLPYLSSVDDDVKVFGVNRADTLARHICMVKDCFPRNDKSHAVYLNGTQSSLCFDRRFAEDEVQVYLDPNSIKYYLKHDLPVWEIDTLKAELTNTGFVNFATATYENLTSYEFDASDTALAQSALEYVRILRHIGIVPNLLQIYDHLNKSGRGNLTRRASTTEIYNLKEVQAALVGTPWSI